MTRGSWREAATEWSSSTAAGSWRAGRSTGSSPRRGIPIRGDCSTRCRVWTATTTPCPPSPGTRSARTRLPAGCPFAAALPESARPVPPRPAAAPGACAAPPRRVPSAPGRCAVNAPLLSVRDLSVTFSVRPEGIRPWARGRPLRAVRDVCFDLAPGRDPGHRGGERVGEVHPRPCADRHGSRLGRAGAVAGRGPAVDGAPGSPSPPPRHPDGLPGPVGGAGPAHDGGRDHRRAARHPRVRTAAGSGEGAGGGDDGAGGSSARAAQPLPARVLGGPVPAHRHRPGADRRTAPRDLRRAGVGPGRERAGPDHQPAAGPEARSESRPDLHRARL